MKSIVFLCCIISQNVFAALDLKESYEAAKSNMESIKRAEALINQTEEQKIRARAAVLPTLSGFGNYTMIDPPSANSPNPFLLTRQHSAGFRLSQPLLRGGSVSAYQLAKENKLLAEFQKQATEINLYQLVISTYYNLALAQLDLKNVEEYLKLSRDRVKEIRQRATIGRSRKGELVEAEAQYKMAESQYQQTQMNLQEAEKNFEFYTKIKPSKINLTSKIPEITSDLEDYIVKLKTRPDLQASEQQIRIAEKRIQIERGSHFPQLDLTSNYFLNRTGILETSKWDVGVALVIPLFQGGGVSASVREAVEGRRIAELQNSENKRSAAREVSIHYQNLIQIKEQLKSLGEALNKSEEAYKLNKRDYEFGLVTNLDVLQTLNIYIETKRSYDSLVALGHLNYKNLEALAGVLP